jgi:hypothetical protein
VTGLRLPTLERRSDDEYECDKSSLPIRPPRRSKSCPRQRSSAFIRDELENKALIINKAALVQRRERERERAPTEIIAETHRRNLNNDEKSLLPMEAASTFLPLETPIDFFYLYVLLLAPRLRSSPSLYIKAIAPL